MDASTLAIADTLVARCEGFRGSPYLDVAGIPTVGFGFTRYRNGFVVTLRDPPMDRGVAESYRRYLVGRTGDLVITLCPAIDTAGRWAALTDFTYNLGLGAFKASTLRRRAMARDWNGTRIELGKWINAAGRPVKGLVLRRAAEAALI